MEKIDLKKIIPKELIRKLEESYIHERKVFPYEEDDKEVTIAMVNPGDMQTIMSLKSKFNKRIKQIQMTEEEFYMLATRYFGIGSGMFSGKERDITFSNDYDIEEDKDNPEVIRFVNQLFLDAYKKGATDIHLEPIKNDVLLRYRIDGVLHNVPLPSAIKSVYKAIVSRVKIMAELDIAEKRMPQDGRIKIKMRDTEQELRISIIPTINGESIVVRILANQKAEMDLEKLGMEELLLKDFRELVYKPNGIVLVTGPTGSGKSTTLFSAIKEINDGEKKILTIEDPVEYQIDGISQIQVKTDIGLSFAAGLRAILRHDPDIIMIGEIRDKETAEIAIRSSLTGHLVFATLHTNDSASAITRLIDMGIEPYLITSSLIGVLAQRLVRKICPYCKTKKVLDNGEETWYGKGCDYCFYTGYKGRTSIHELFKIDDYNKKDILAGNTSFQVKAKLIEDGWNDLKADGMIKAKKGVTTIDEVLRVAW